MSKVIAYCRVSTEKQEVEGTSLDTQQTACVAKAQEVAGPGDEITLLRETYSGLSLERPELNKLREWVRQGQVKAVVSYSCDRLSRDGLHLLLVVDEIEKAGAKVVFVTEPHEGTPEGQLLTYVRGWASKLEALRIKERTIRGRKQRARNGRIPSGGALYGYLYMKGKGEARGIRLPDTDKGPIVQNIFNWYVQEGTSLEALRKRLYALGIPSPAGKASWTAATLLRLLSQRAYTGQTVSEWTTGGLTEAIEVTGATPALISQAVFDAAQERLRLNKENAKRRGKLDYVLRGMVFCRCGRRMAGVATGGIRGYRCSGHKWDPNTHCGARVNAGQLEDAVWGQVKDMLANPDLIEAQMTERFGNAKGASELSTQIKTIDARLKALSHGEAAIARKLRLGELSEEVAGVELRQGKADREALEREKTTLQGQLESVKRWAEVDIDGLCKSALLNLDNPTFDAKRLALQAFAVRVTVEGENVQVKVNFPIGASPDMSSELHPSGRGWG